MSQPAARQEARVIAKGRYLTLLEEGGWEYVTRPGITGVVVIVPFTPDGKLVLIEQRRPAVGRSVVELPAGLVGDLDGQPQESLLDAARRELIEETGYAASELVPLGDGPVAVGVCDEIVTIILARGLSRVGPGGGDATEQITVREVALADLPRFLDERKQAGLAIDVKLFAGLWLAGVTVPR
jgi:ADP-ribose pyrophosphatase